MSEPHRHRAMDPNPDPAAVEVYGRKTTSVNVDASAGREWKMEHACKQSFKSLEMRD